MLNSKKRNKKIIIRIALFTGTAISLWFVPWILVKAWILPLPDTVQEQVDQAISHGLDGMIVYVDEAGKQPEFYTGGWHNREHKIPAKPNALFKIASISKLYVAVSISKLVNDNRLSLDKTLADYFPELLGRIENADRITLKMMVQHRSGIPNFTDSGGYWENPPDSAEESLALVLDTPALFEPGEDYSYSNTNYLLLGLLIDNTVGYNHHQYIKEQILVPLELNNTFFSLSEVDIEGVMSGYYVGYEPDLKEKEFGMLATAEDVGIFLRALNDGSIFKERERKIYSEIYEYEHSGWVPGYQSFTEYHNNIDTVVILFNNTTDEDLLLWNLSEIMINRVVRIVEENRAK
ncbi:beta-lactamase [Tamlana sedimentorum]|uniref:Beta-lactamase n=1 Tax=Neotamlana sedimentorum TaxID=1435349 RepID=A0A0D7W285_9FLAO|nr:serine hydrolase domain-containing protein [Tamlana sedimentorum]KJD32798.1 beta-lactamase [Tamlana sedimentorum]